MLNKEEKQLSKFISLILRHKPQEVGIELDKNGWTDVSSLLIAINKAGSKIDRVVLEKIVAENDKKRFSFSEDKTKIRANQGHSIEVDVELKQQEPPEFLYHGTGEKYLNSILEEGIQKKNRLYVHLSKDEETAKLVGSRHGKPVVLKIKAKKLYENGTRFYLSDNGVWLVDEVKPQFFDII